jgi:hypothetical protein
MLVKYRMNSTATLTTLKADLHKIISGQITTVADFGTGCDKTNTLVYGTYPTGKYTVENAGTYTYSKVHGQYSDTTHYFRLNFGATYLDSISLSKSYTSGTNTLVNAATSVVNRPAWTTYGNASASALQSASGYYKKGQFYGNVDAITAGDIVTVQGNGYWVSNEASLYGYAFKVPNNIVVTSITGNNPVTATLSKVPGRVITVGTLKPQFTGWRGGNINVSTFVYSSLLPNALDVVITDKCFFIGSTTNNAAYGIFDISKNGVTRGYPNSMLMAMINVNDPNNGVIVPYTYKIDTTTYGTVTNGTVLGQVPTRINQADTNTVSVIENPTFVQFEEAGYAQSAVYGLYKIPDSLYVSSSIYKDASNVYRVVYSNFSIYTE